MAIRARFVGSGAEFVNGVPTRHLTDDEFDALTPEQQRAVLETRGSDGHLLYAVRDKSDAVQAVTPRPAVRGRGGD